MVKPKANGLLFETWMADNVVREAGARTAFADLFRDYQSYMSGAGMGRQGFVARLNEMRIGEVKEKGVRWRLGLRLKGESEASRATATFHTSPAPGDAPQPVMAMPFAAPTVDLPDDDGIYRIAPYTGGPAVRCVILEAESDDDLASALVARELHRARVRQRAPKVAGGEGFSNERDDHYAGDLALAASAFAFAAGQPEDYRAFLEMNGKPVRTAQFGWHVLEIVRRLWPWDVTWWKPKSPRADLERAGALVIAGIEKIDRAEARARLSAEERRLATGV